jgi:hypothetical protein
VVINIKKGKAKKLLYKKVKAFNQNPSNKKKTYPET